MSSIIKKIKKGRPYYYAVECKRVNGKPRIVWQKYLGTVERIVERAEGAKPPKPKESVIFEAGGVAALLGISEQLGLRELINEVAPKREQGPSMGHYMILAALNRALCPLSKQKIGDWYETTVLRRLWGFNKRAFSSQRFWDHMDRLSEENIKAIEGRVLLAIEKNFGLDSRVLLYDTTNFFTFLATTNDRCSLAQRGRGKQKRHDLRQLGLALMVSHDFQIPLLHHVYPGNITDVSLFPSLWENFMEKYRRVTGSDAESTLVFDKGNVSDATVENLLDTGTHFVTALSANQCQHLLHTDHIEFDSIKSFPGTQAFETTEILWGRSCRVVVVYTESFFSQQLHGVTQNLVKCQKKLSDLAKSLEGWREGKHSGRKPTVASVRKSVKRILSPQFMKELFTVQVHNDQKTSIPILTYQLDHETLHRLTHQRLGRTILVSDRLDWDAPQIIEAYRSLSAIEKAFKNMKNTDYLHWQPAYHWTDQKLRVHAFYCVLALAISSLARQRVCQAGLHLPLMAMLDELSKIHEVAVIYPTGTLAHRKDHITLSRMSPRQKKLANILDIATILNKKG